MDLARVGGGADSVSRNGRPLSRCSDMPRNCAIIRRSRSEEHTSELQSLMRISYAVFCLKKKKLQQIIISNGSSLTSHLNKHILHHTCTESIHTKQQPST